MSSLLSRPKLHPLRTSHTAEPAVLCDAIVPSWQDRVYPATRKRLRQGSDGRWNAPLPLASGSSEDTSMARCSLATPPRYTRRSLSSLAALLGLTVPGACSFQETTNSSRLSATPPLGGTVQHVYWGGDVGLTLRYAMDRFPARVPGARVELLAIPNDQV